MEAAGEDTNVLAETSVRWEDAIWLNAHQGITGLTKENVMEYFLRSNFVDPRSVNMLVQLGRLTEVPQNANSDSRCWLSPSPQPYHLGRGEGYLAFH